MSDEQTDLAEGTVVDSATDDRRRPSIVAGVSDGPMTLEQIERRLQDHFPNVSSQIVYGELTLHVSPGDLLEVLTFCRDDEELRCGMLSDLSGVHWPAGDQVIERQPSTTGWPEYRVSRDEGRIEVLYILRSLERNHWFRLSTSTSDEDPRLPSATGIYASADYPEREAYDFFGIHFEGHANLSRILMPDDWVGHPHRKDYPLGGVDIPYENDKFIPPPNERDLRDIVGGEG